MIIGKFLRIATILASALGAGAASAQVGVSELCGESALEGDLDLHEVGPAIAGTYTELAPGIGFTAGVQESTVEIVYAEMRNRVYIAADGIQVELRPVRSGWKSLRWDYRRGEPLPESAHASEIGLADTALTLGCEFAPLPQFEWTYGSGNRSAGGVITFVGPDGAIGVKWNSARGAREQILMRASG